MAGGEGYRYPLFALAAEAPLTVVARVVWWKDIRQADDAFRYVTMWRALATLEVEEALSGRAKRGDRLTVIDEGKVRSFGRYFPEGGRVLAFLQEVGPEEARPPAAGAGTIYRVARGRRGCWVIADKGEDPHVADVRAFLGARGAPPERAGPAFLKLAAGGNDWVRESAMVELGKMGWRPAAPVLAEALGDARWASVAGQALARLPADALVPVRERLFALAGSSVPHARASAAAAVARLEGPEPFEWLAARARDRAREVRAAAVAALGGRAEPETEPLLRRALGDQELVVRRAAHRALVERGVNLAPFSTAQVPSGRAP